MSNESITLNVVTRKPGKGNNRNLRNEKMIPAVVYGSKQDNINLSLDEFSATKYSGYGYENTIFNFKSDEGSLNGLSVIMKEATVHPVTRRPIHLDFYAVDMTATIKVPVEIKFEGKAKGVAEEGGIFNTLLRDIEVECLPAKIPDSLTLDISNMAVGDTLHISDLQLPDGVTATAGENLALANVTAKKAEEEEKPAAEADAAADAEAPKE